MAGCLALVAFVAATWMLWRRAAEEHENDVGGTALAGSRPSGGSRLPRDRDGSADGPSERSEPVNTGARRGPRGGVARPHRDGLLPKGEASITVLLVDQQEFPVLGADVTLTHPVGQESGTTDAGGRVLFAGLASGSYEARIHTGDGHELVSAEPRQVSDGEASLWRLVWQSPDRSIGGRVLASDGERLAGVDIEASLYQARVREGALVPIGDPVWTSVSGDDGSFLIEGLTDGEYTLATAPGPGFGSTRRVVRAGLLTVDLVVPLQATLRVYGTVRDADARGIVGVRVVSLGHPAAQSFSDDDGSFELDLPLGSAQHLHTIAFCADGFRSKQVHLRHADIAAADEWPVDVVLEDTGPTTGLTGRLVDTEGFPVAGETVYLQSIQEAFREHQLTGEDGGFEFESLPLASDYRLWVYPRMDFRDLAQEGLEISAEGLDLVVELEPLGVGFVRGRLVDIRGRSIPHFNLWVRSADAIGRALPLTSDADGHFEVDQVPVGALTFETRSEPRLFVRGLSLAEGSEADVEIVLDWGTDDVAGSVVDADGNPVSAARVTLTWQHAWKAGRSSSHRSTRSDDGGEFRFSQLGPGSHSLSVEAPGFRRQKVTVEPGADPAELRVVLVGARAPRRRTGPDSEDDS